jgi:phosphate starvation-inducible protein PhoH
VTDVTHRVSAEGADMLALAGVNDHNLIELARATGARVTLRGDQLLLVGPLEAVERATRLAAALVDRARGSDVVTPDELERLLAHGPEAVRS